MPIPAFFKVRFEGGRGHHSREFFLPNNTLDSCESLYHALEEQLGSDLQFRGSELQGENPVLTLKAYNCTISADSWEPAENLQNRRPCGSDDFLTVSWPGLLSCSPLYEAAATLKMPAQSPSSEASSLALPSYKHRLPIRTSDGPGWMKYEELQGFTQPTAELQLESSLENRVAVLDVFTDAMLASQGKPQIVAGFSDTLQVWARGLYSKGQYAVSEEAGSGAALYLFPFQQDKLGIQFLGFFLPRQEVHNASLLRHRILLVLDLDETLVTTKRLAGVQYYLRQCCMLDDGETSPARQAVQKKLLEGQKHGSTLLEIAKKWACHKYPAGSMWQRQALIVGYLNKQLLSLQCEGTYQVFRDGALHSDRLLLKVRTNQLPPLEDVNLAVELNELMLKLYRLWFLLGGCKDAQQLQRKVDVDPEVQSLAKAAKLRVEKYAASQHRDSPKHTFRVHITGCLQANGRDLNEFAVYTQYIQEEHPEQGITKASWQDVMFLMRPHVTRMLEELCNRDGDQHQCEVAVCTAAPCLGYAHTILKKLDPAAAHLRAPQATFVGRAGHKHLRLLTTMPHTAVIMDDCPGDYEGSSTVWPAEDLRHGLHVPDYIPFVDQDFILSGCEKLKRVVTLYRREWEQFRKSVDWLDGQPTALVQNLSEVRKHLPSTERAVEHVKRRAYNNLWAARSGRSGSAVADNQDTTDVTSIQQPQHMQQWQTAPSQRSAQAEAMQGLPLQTSQQTPVTPRLSSTLQAQASGSWLATSHGSIAPISQAGQNLCPVDFRNPPPPQSDPRRRPSGPFQPANSSTKLDLAAQKARQGSTGTGPLPGYHSGSAEPGSVNDQADANTDGRRTGRERSASSDSHRHHKNSSQSDHGGSSQHGEEDIRRRDSYNSHCSASLQSQHGNNGHAHRGSRLGTSHGSRSSHYTSSRSRSQERSPGHKRRHSSTHQHESSRFARHDRRRHNE